jgi:hypothetical protein
MSPFVLKEFLLQCPLHIFLKDFWLETKWYERFLSEKLEDLSVTVGEWNSIEGSSTSFTRNVKSYHPSKISFPGLPSHAEVIASSKYVYKYSLFFTSLFFLRYLYSYLLFNCIFIKNSLTRFMYTT